MAVVAVATDRTPKIRPAEWLDGKAEYALLTLHLQAAPAFVRYSCGLCASFEIFKYAFAGHLFTYSLRAGAATDIRHFHDQCLMCAVFKVQVARVSAAWRYGTRPKCNMHARVHKYCIGAEFRRKACKCGSHLYHQIYIYVQPVRICFYVVI